MEITEVRVRLRNDTEKKLKAYVTVTFDHEFVVRDVKVIEGKKGLFVAMPSRKLRESCPQCNFGNEVRSKFCCQCGHRLEDVSKFFELKSEAKNEHRDLAHPITPQAREYIQSKVLEMYETERTKINELTPKY